MSAASRTAVIAALRWCCRARTVRAEAAAARSGTGIPARKLQPAHQRLLSLVQVVPRHGQQTAQPGSVDQPEPLGPVSRAGSNAASVVAARSSWPTRTNAQICSGRHQKAAGSS